MIDDEKRADLIVCDAMHELEEKILTVVDWLGSALQDALVGEPQSVINAVYRKLSDELNTMITVDMLSVDWQA